MRRVAILALALLSAAPVRAQVNVNEADPAVWLRQVYALYERAQKDDKLFGAASVGLVEKRASKSLAALFRRDAACSAKRHEVCALDWDFVIDGQDYKISHVNVGKTEVAGDKASVTVSFVNMKRPTVNVYRFVREGGAWKVDDIETRPKGEAPADIAKLLRDFKY